MHPSLKQLSATWVAYSLLLHSLTRLFSYDVRRNSQTSFYQHLRAVVECPVMASTQKRTCVHMVSFHCSGLSDYSLVNYRGQSQFSGSMLFAEVASCQMEYKYLARLTDRPEFYQKVRKSVKKNPFFLPKLIRTRVIQVERIMHILRATQSNLGMWPTRFNIESGLPMNSMFFRFTFDIFWMVNFRSPLLCRRMGR